MFDSCYYSSYYNLEDMNSKEIKSIAINKAKQSFCRYKISAIGLDKHGTIIGTATNRPRIDRKFGGLHAEIVLIRRYKENLKTIIICRVSNAGTVLPIVACEKCQKVMEKMNIDWRTIK